MLAVETIDLTKDFASGFWRKRPRRALDRLSLKVVPGEVFGILGPNGAGKTTTLKILMRLIFPTSGTATVLGRPLGDTSSHARIGFLPENPYFYDYLSAEEFLHYAGGLFGLSRAETRRRTRHLLEKVGLADSANLPLRKYSKGMVQRLGIAQALINDPDLVILDEPMSGLDPIGRREVRDLILELKAGGKTILFSTHILSDAEALCDRVAILNRGRLQGCGELGEILAVGVTSAEVVMENPPPALVEKLNPAAGSVVRTGTRLRLEIPAGADLNAVLEVIARSGARIISVNPVKMSLEDFFLSRISAEDSRPAEKVAAGRERAR